jgi:hypothetical protein
MRMKKYMAVAAVALALSACATMAPEAKIDWSTVNTPDLDALRRGKIQARAAAVLDAAGKVLKAQGFELAPNAGENTVTTVRKHGVTVYGSVDYSMTCQVKEEAGVTKLNWSTISYVTEFLTNVDPIGYDSADKWNYGVYMQLADSGVIKREQKPVEAVKPAETPAVPAANDGGLPAPPAEE